MFWYKLKNFFLFSTLVLLAPQISFAMFADDECMESNFKILVSHKGFPLGLTENILRIDKNKCVLRIDHEKLKFVKNSWTIDICRTPIHIKKGTSTIEVIKRANKCSADDSQGGPFCSEWRKIKQTIQDDGLIFAEGEKENLSSTHGRMYCSYLLVKKYLQEGIIFNRGNHLNNILKQGQGHYVEEEEVPVVPTPRPAEEAPSSQQNPEKKEGDSSLKF